MRVGFDLSKAHHPDGIGTWQRQSAKALAARAPADKLELFPLSLTAPWTAESRERIRAALGDAADAFAWDKTSAREDALAREKVRSLDAVISSAWAVPRGLRGRLIFVVHDLTFLTLPHCHTPANRLHCLEGLLRAALTTETRFVTVSEDGARRLATALGGGGDSGPAPTVIHNGVDAFWTPRPAASTVQNLRERFDLRPDGYVLCVGSLEPRKNLERLFSAHGSLPEALRRRFPLAVVGGHGWMLEALIRRLGDDPWTRFLGRVDDSELLDLYNGTALFVYPSLAEGFGLPVAEAMACGAPVLTSNTTSLPEVVGNAAVTVDPEDASALADALGRLLADPDERRSLGALGPARAARFTWDSGAQKLLDLLAVRP